LPPDLAMLAEAGSSILLACRPLSAELADGGSSTVLACRVIVDFCRPCSQMEAPQHSLQCTQMADPPQTGQQFLHCVLFRQCSQIEAPQQSLHCILLLLCLQMEAPPHALPCLFRGIFWMGFNSSVFSSCVVDLLSSSFDSDGSNPRFRPLAIQASRSSAYLCTSGVLDRVPSMLLASSDSTNVNVTSSPTVMTSRRANNIC
jgi:hypothetical protein